MKIVVNALSVTNLSGRHVLLGHLEQAAAAAAPETRFVVLHHAANADIRRDLGERVRWIECPPWTRRWLPRTVWERVSLPGSGILDDADWLVSPAGTVVPGLPVRQLAFAQNPWCLVPEVHRGVGERLKAALQRSAYRRAMAEADLMVFNSEFMRDAYRANAGFRERRSFVAPQGLDRATWDAAERLDGVARDPLRVVSVSQMAPHKGAEVLVEALRRVREEHGVPATLSLVGSWPDPRYESRVRRLVARLGLDDVVDFRGFVDRDELHRAYASARVFGLLSRCESFGIPAVEAQAFGTPVVTSDCCAVPEVCGEGGAFCAPTDAGSAAAAIAGLLTDEARWEEASRAARRNAERYRWEGCSEPFVEALRRCESGGDAREAPSRTAA